jgi:hypothetical protein
VFWKAELGDYEEGFEERGRWPGPGGTGKGTWSQGQADCSLGGGLRRRLELSCEGGGWPAEEGCHGCWMLGR